MFVLGLRYVVLSGPEWCAAFPVGDRQEGYVAHPRLIHKRACKKSKL